jgi:hypothetical protein
MVSSELANDPTHATEVPMAQATYVTSAIRPLITGANAKQSTNPFPAIHANKLFTARLLYDMGRAA